MVIVGGVVGCEWWGEKGSCERVRRCCRNEVGGAKCPVGKCYRAGLRLSIGFLAHACSVMIE